MSTSQQNNCGACKGIEARTPASVENNSGLSALAYRVGTHGSFKESMLAALAKHSELRGLTTRSDDDPTVALIDSWSAVLDVLGFYQERIANEGYLRTAVERRSVLELARSIGYELRPGVAASTYLAFTLEDVPGAPEQVRIAVGTKVQSLPGQDELPQTFETVEEREGRGAWNNLTPRTSLAQSIEWGISKIYLNGTTTQLQLGDPLLIVGAERREDVENENWDLRMVKAIELDRDRGITTVTFDSGLGSLTPFMNPAGEDIHVYALRGRAALFGNNAPDWKAMPSEVRERYVDWYNDEYTPDPDLTEADADDWPGLTLEEIADPNVIDYLQLDTTYPKIVPESWIVLSRPGYRELYEVEEVVEDSRSRFTLSGKTTRVLTRGENLYDVFNDYVRETIVYAQSEELELAEQPITDPVPVPGQANSVVLNNLVDGLYEGQLFAISGTGTDGEEASEVLELERTEEVDGKTRLIFTSNLANEYQRESVAINANVARATHGETKTEVLGSGNGSETFQKFVLKNNPLTYVSAPTASGVESTLEVRVNDVLWEETDTFYGLSPKSRSYTLRLDDDGTTRVLFGDGDTGARLPTGTENVKATYRTGIGLDGLVKKKQLSLLLTRSLGLKKVSNPTAPTGAADPERLEDARSNAPLTVLTLDRIVSLRDFEDFTRAFAGIGKALAAEMWDGERRLVHITLAGPDGAEIVEDSETYTNLLAGIDAARHADQLVLTHSYEARSFNVQAKVLVHEDYIAEDVLANVKTQLIEAFSFNNQSFAQSLTSSEVIAVMQAVEGVEAIDLDALYLSTAAPSLQSRLVALPARWDSGTVRPAQLLTINSEGISLTEMTQ